MHATGRLRLLCLFAAGLVAPLGPAHAQTSPAAQVTGGLGVNYAPDYPGADSYSFGPAGVLRFDFVRFPNGVEFGSSGSVGYLSGFGPRGSVRYLGSRKASDNAELRGLDNIDAALEIGLGLGFEQEYWRAFGDVRYGAVGHSAWVGEFGADAILRPNDQLVINFGPRASWGNSRFLDTYFGVTEKESDRSGVKAFDASSGFYGVGAELGARYAFSQNWGVEGRAGYELLVGDAGDSPITDIGSANQFELQVLITRSLSLGF